MTIYTSEGYTQTFMLLNNIDIYDFMHFILLEISPPFLQRYIDWWSEGFFSYELMKNDVNNTVDLHVDFEDI